MGTMLCVCARLCLVQVVTTSDGGAVVTSLLLPLAAVNNDTAEAVAAEINKQRYFVTNTSIE